MAFTPSTHLRLLLPALALSLGLLTGCSGQATQVPIATASSASAHKININSAILSELDKIEGQIGIPSLSNRIQAARPYASPEELVSKKILTQEQFDRIKDQVSVEDVELVGEAKDIDFMTKLGLMRGHLLVAKEWLDRKQPALALPHIGHPIEEIYVDLEGQLDERKVKPFKAVLQKLQVQTQFSPNSPELTTTYAEALQGIDTAMAALPASQRRDPRFVLSVISEMLDAAGTEYGAAVSNGKVSAHIEYEDSRGFVLFAKQLFTEVAPTLAKSDASRAKEISESFTKLQTAWPAIDAPAVPVMTVDQVRTAIKSVELAGQKVASL
jgi:hypothetical protein